MLQFLQYFPRNRSVFPASEKQQEWWRNYLQSKTGGGDQIKMEKYSLLMKQAQMGLPFWGFEGISWTAPSFLGVIIVSVPVHFSATVRSGLQLTRVVSERICYAWIKWRGFLSSETTSPVSLWEPSTSPRNNWISSRYGANQANQMEHFSDKPCIKVHFSVIAFMTIVSYTGLPLK